MVGGASILFRLLATRRQPGRWFVVGSTMLTLGCGGDTSTNPRAPSPTAPAASAVASPVSKGMPGWMLPLATELRLPAADRTHPLPNVPNVLLSHGGLFLDGQKLASYKELAPEGRPMRVDQLFIALREKRKSGAYSVPPLSAGGGAADALWLPYRTGRLNFWVDASVSAAVVKSVHVTAGYAGFGHGAFVVRSRGGSGEFAVLPFNAPTPWASGATGRLAPEVIQRIVRANYGAFRKCYEAGLGRNRDLTGKVAARFVISEKGAVTSVKDAGSDIADLAVRDCVFAEMKKMTFPAPNGGIVTVVYPIVFSPADPPLFESGDPLRKDPQPPPN